LTERVVLVLVLGTGAGSAEQTPIAQAKEQLETNFWGTVRVVQAALPVMRRQGGGRLVSVAKIDERVGIIGKRVLFERAAKRSLGV
jgi:NAD(P)-dependent dehydrogenase (short-subunit alcohol dehydrogenase family)